jgi:hypothetical protein
MNVLQNIKMVPLVRAQAAKNNAEWVGSKGSTPAYVDTFGWNECSVYCTLGAIDIAIAELEVWECATSGGSYTLVTDAEFGASGNAALPAADADTATTFLGNYAFHIPLAGRMRFLEIYLKAGNNSASYATAFALLACPDTIPDSAAERGLDAEIFVGA